MLLHAVAALVVTQFLPGFLAVKLLRLGRSREESYLIAAVLSGPLSALFYLAALHFRFPALYWVLAGAVGLAAVLVPFRTERRFAWPRSSVLLLAGLLGAVLLSYGLTTGRLYRTDAAGNLLLDRALQRDALFHIGLVRSLETSYPPRLLSVSGIPIGYHVGYHLQLALWSRYFGIDPFDGLIRLGAMWELLLYLFGGYLLACRFASKERARLLSVALLFASGFGFAFFFRPSVDWWSLVFMDWTLVSLFLANPLLPGLPLLFVGLSLVGDFWETGSRGALAGSAFALAFLFLVKLFLAAQLLAALGLATALRWRDRRAWVLTATLALASLPVGVSTLLAASGSNTSVGLRPLEIVRYSMEKLDWERAVHALAAVGELHLHGGGLGLAIVAALLWLAGFLGLRLLGLAGAFRALAAPSFLHRTLAWFVAIGFPLSLLLRIAPSEAEGLSRLEALNDAGWFVTASGVLLWLFTAKVLSRFRPVVASGLVLALALPATFQHFRFAASLEPDRIARSRVEAAHEARALSAPEAVWVDPPDRARPSLLPYLAGRSVVYDSYVGYDYMFVGRDEIDFRRHSVAQFWSSDDPAYAAWFLDHFRVEYLWEEGRRAPAMELDGLERLYATDGLALYRVREEEVSRALTLEIPAPGRIPMGGPGFPYFGSGWRPDERSRSRLLGPGEATLYFPSERGRDLFLVVELATPHEAGNLIVEGVGRLLSADESRARISVPPRRTRGLQTIGIEWTGRRPLVVRGITVASEP